MLELASLVKKRFKVYLELTIDLLCRLKSANLHGKGHEHRLNPSEENFHFLVSLELLNLFV